MNYKLITLTFLLVIGLYSCSSDSDPIEEETNTVEETTIDVTIEDIKSINSETHEDANDYTYETSSITEITLNGNTITVNGDGATVEASTVTITNAGTYRVTGSLTDGQIIVNSEDSEKVQLLFNGINVYCSYNAPVYIEQSEKTIIILEENTQNYISDGDTYEEKEEDANAALFSKSDLSISGLGTLIVTGNYNDGITGKDGLVINSGIIIVNSEDDGIRGKDYLVINNADITLNTEGDGLKSDNDSVDDKGFIAIENVNLIVVSNGDAIQAETSIIITYGEFNLTSGGGSNAAISDDDSAKGIKAETYIAIVDGLFEINSADDGIHSDNSILINGGSYEIATGDDGIHANEFLEINDGTLEISNSIEGIEASIININNGTITIAATDDGINATMGSEVMNDDGSQLNVNGGDITVNMSGNDVDAMDSNGDITIIGGTVKLNFPTQGPSGGLDANGTITIGDNATVYLNGVVY